MLYTSLTINHILPHIPCESKVEKKNSKGSNSIDEEGWKYFYDDNKRSKNTSVRLLSVLFMLSFPPFFLLYFLLLYTFFSSSSSCAEEKERETPGQVMNQQSSRVLLSGSKEIDEAKVWFFCYFAHVVLLFIFHFFVYLVHICASRTSPRAIFLSYSFLFLFQFFFLLSVCLKG